MYRRALNRNVFDRFTATANRTVSTSRTVITAAVNNVHGHVHVVQKQTTAVPSVFARYSSGMSALNEAQNPQVGEGLEAGKGKGGKAQVIDGNAIAK